MKKTPGFRILRETGQRFAGRGSFMLCFFLLVRSIRRGGADFLQEPIDLICECIDILREGNALLHLFNLAS